METIQAVDYVVVLSTGERITLAEFDPERIECMKVQEVLDASADVLQRCTRAPREALENAKKGHDAKLRLLLRTPPIGALLKVSQPICSERRVCSMFREDACTTRNLLKSGGGFPECWEQHLEQKLPGPVEYSARGLCTAIVHAWRQGQYVVIVE